MHEFVRKQIGSRVRYPSINRAFFVDAVVARFVMLEAEVRHVVAQREQEMVVAIVAHAEERAGFGD